MCNDHLQTMIRIIGGAYKGRSIKTLRGRMLRPTSDKVREAIFDILGGGVRGADVLDLFAGTGALGIEALSRGAARAVFVENHRPMAIRLRKNLEEVERASAISRVMCLDYHRALMILRDTLDTFDIVFADPPYGKGLAGKILKEISDGIILSETGVAVIEHTVKEALDEDVCALRLSDRRKYGDTQVSFYRRNS